MTTIQIILLSIGGILSLIGWGFLIRNIIYKETHVFPLICFLISIFFLILAKLDTSLECLLIILYIILIVPSYYLQRRVIRRRFPRNYWEWSNVIENIISSLFWPIFLPITFILYLPKSSPPKWL